jgi:hypothetical protein
MQLNKKFSVIVEFEDKLSVSLKSATEPNLSQFDPLHIFIIYFS